jgi:hypothetical protein
VEFVVDSKRLADFENFDSKRMDDKELGKEMRIVNNTLKEMIQRKMRNEET